LALGGSGFEIFKPGPWVRLTAGFSSAQAQAMASLTKAGT